MNMLLAVLEKRVDLSWHRKTSSLNIAGGLKVNDPAIDLAVISAILSSNMMPPSNKASAWRAKSGYRAKSVR